MKKLLLLSILFVSTCFADIRAVDYVPLVLDGLKEVHTEQMLFKIDPEYVESEYSFEGKFSSEVTFVPFESYNPREGERGESYLLNIPVLGYELIMLREGETDVYSTPEGFSDYETTIFGEEVSIAISVAGRLEFLEDEIKFTYSVIHQQIDAISGERLSTDIATFEQFVPCQKKKVKKLKKKRRNCKNKKSKKKKKACRVVAKEQINSCKF